MKKVELDVMGMPITIEVKGEGQGVKVNQDIEKVFEYFKYVDEKYSPFKETSDVSKYNRGEKVSKEMKLILSLSQDLHDKTNGYFDIVKPNGRIDPSGIVKGWAILNASKILKDLGYDRFFVDAGGDAEIVGKNWKWGIRNPFNVKEIVKVLNLSNCGIATSGTYERGQHIYNPITKENKNTDIISLTVIGPDVFEADKMSTPAFAIGRAGIKFIESLPGLEGYMIDKNGIATMTSGFKKFVI